jgi:N-acetylmuramoyl-L-alanine amidase
MKFGIDIGHNCPPDGGAVGIKAENALNMEVGKLVISKLEALGHEVVDCTPKLATSVSDSLRQRARKSNAEKVGLYVSIHFNAFNRKAHGAEVFAISPIGKAYSASVLEEICKLGFFNRGVKDGSHLSVIKNTVAPAILIECCFCDSKRDMDLYDAEEMAAAIVRGLVEC